MEKTLTATQMDFRRHAAARRSIREGISNERITKIIDVTHRAIDEV
jgi:hypothetical protein